LKRTPELKRISELKRTSRLKRIFELKRITALKRTAELKRLPRLITFAALSALAACGLLLISCTTRHDELSHTARGWRASVTTLAGDGSPGFQDGAASNARFNDPFGIAVASDGSVYVADAGEANRIRKVTPQGEVLTVAGGHEGYADGAGAAASFNTPSALALDGAGNLYVADTGNNRIRRVASDGNVTTLAGDGTAGFRDGTAGAPNDVAGSAQFDAPVGVAVDKDGNVYVADTYNDRVRLITKDGRVKTIAGAGSPGYADGDALSAALFDTPCGIVVSEAGEVFVADTGNNRLRKITKDGQVTTLPVVSPPADNTHSAPNSDTHSAPNSETNPDPTSAANAAPNAAANPAPGSAVPFELSKPVGLALTRDGFLYVTELDRGRVVQVAPDGTARVIAGLGSGFADGDGQSAARFNQPAGIALTSDGSLLVADGANYLLRRVSPSQRRDGTVALTEGRDNIVSSTEGRDGVVSPAERDGATTPPLPPHEVLSPSHEAPPPSHEVLPRIYVESLGSPFPWPLDPQEQWHEVAATMGEVRGAYGTDDSRDHLHNGLDVFGVYGQTVRAVREEKVSSPLANWGFGSLNEGLRSGLLSYVHLRVGRDEHDEMLKGTPFVAVRDDAGQVARVRVRRGTRLRLGDALGTINRMFHVHMILGPPGAEMNPLSLPFAGFADHSPPKIERDGVQLFDEDGARMTLKRAGRLMLRGRVSIVVDAYDQVDGNQPRRRLGLYKLGYQLLLPDGNPAPGFEQPRIRIEFNRLPPGGDAPKIAYAGESGITVYGSKQTRFLYEVTNTVRDGYAARSAWDTSELPAGDYTLRIIAADFNGNEADANRDLPVTIARD
jgi:sugar lactone lactonase YvrE